MNSNLPIKGIRALSLIDYPGKMSAVVFFGGCNFRCPFCHNWELAVEPGSFDTLDSNFILDELERRRKLLDGVVLTGGEPTLYPDIIDFSREIKKLGYEIKLDTNGYRPDVLQSFIEHKLVDFISMDVKSAFQKEPYSKASGVSVNLDLILKSVEQLIKCKEIDYEFRTTVIKDYVSFDDILNIAKHIHGAKKYFLQRANENWKDFKGMSEDDLQRALESLIEMDINVEIR